MTTPAISSPPNAVSSNARLVAVACRPRGQRNPAAGSSTGETGSATGSGSCSGASNIGSILTGPTKGCEKCCRCEIAAPVGPLTPARGTAESNLAAVIDLKLLRDDPDAVRRSQLSRGEDPALVDALLTADAARRAAISTADNLRAEQKTASKSVGKASAEERPALLQRAKELAEQVKAAEAEQAQSESAFTAAHMAISNVVLDGVPAGGEDDYAVLDVVGEPATLDNPKDHLELGESLGLIDMQRGAKVSGSRFYFLTGRGALLQLGLLQLALGVAVDNGFIPMIPPVLVRPEVMAGTGFLGAHADEVYRVEADDLYLVGTSEVPLAGYHSGEILDLSGGPLRYAGWSSCFRREAGSYGKDTRGIIRVHQFDKMEGFVYCTPTRPKSNMSGCWAGSARCWHASRCPTGSSTSPRVIWAPLPRASSTARRGFRRSRLTGN